MTLVQRILSVLFSFLLSLGALLFPQTGSRVILRFDANPSTGYTWVCEVEPEGVVEIQKEWYRARPTLFPVTGSGGTYTYIIVPVADGNATLTFYYMRPWEGPESATEILQYQFLVVDGRVAVGLPVGE